MGSLFMSNYAAGFLWLIKNLDTERGSVCGDGRLLFDAFVCLSPSLPSPHTLAVTLISHYCCFFTPPVPVSSLALFQSYIQ